VVHLYYGTTINKKKRKAIVSETTIIIKSRLIDGNFHVRQKSKKEKVNNFKKKRIIFCFTFHWSQKEEQKKTEVRSNFYIRLIWKLYSIDEFNWELKWKLPISDGIWLRLESEKLFLRFVARIKVVNWNEICTIDCFKFEK